MKKIIIWAVIAAAIIAIVTAVSVRSSSMTATRTSQSPVVIGYIGPLTGPSAVLGMDAVKAVQMAVDETNAAGGINGTKAVLVAQDDQYLTRNTVSAYRKMVDTDHARVILVATYGGMLALKDLAAKDGIVLVDLLDCNADIADASRNAFCIATETESIGQSLANYLVSQGQLKAGIMYSTKDQFMSLVANAFRTVYEEHGGVVAVESFNYDDADFRTQLVKIKASKPDALVLLGHDETGSIMAEARALGMRAPFLTTGTITSPGAQQLAKGAAEGTVFAYWDADPSNAAAKSFTEAFSKLVGRPPILPLTTHPAYDTAKILLTRVFPEVGADADANAIDQALLRVKNYQGITGTINMSSSGAAAIKESVYRLEKGIPVKI